MKKIIFLICLLFGTANVLMGQASCNGSGTFNEAAIPNYTAAATGNFGNGTAGYARVCITAATVGTDMCSGTGEHLRIRETDGTLLGTVTSATVLPVCFTSTLNNGLISVQDYCATGTNSYTLTWDTYTTVGGAVSACCTSNASLCSDGIQNGCETGVDCGDVCPLSCGASCSDNIQNQGETAIDCGGPCPACGASCATFSSQTMNPAAGSIIDARAADQTITSCVNITYNNSGSNWVHGVYIAPTSTGFLSSAASGALPEANVASMGTTYQWSNQTANFTSTNSGNSITANGWFVETGALNGNPGNNLGWPVAANTNLGPFCFTTVVSCSGLTGDIAATMNFSVTSDSYSGAWTNNNCGLETSSGAASLSYTLRCPVPLPIDLLSFNGKNYGSYNEIIWEPVHDDKSEYYILMKSVDGATWEEYKQVTRETGLTKVTDDTPAENITYYKLRQFDFDGEMKESNIIGVISSQYFEKLAVIPNPVEDKAILFFTSTETTQSHIRISDISGKVVYELDFITEKGTNTISLDTESYRNGMYFIEIQNDFDTKKLKFIKE